MGQSRHGFKGNGIMSGWDGNMNDVTSPTATFLEKIAPFQISADSTDTFTDYIDFELKNHISIQAICSDLNTAAGLELTLQASNIPGTDPLLWVDVATAVAVAANGAYAVAPSDKIRNFKYYRIKGVKTGGGTPTLYFLAYGVTAGPAQ